MPAPKRNLHTVKPGETPKNKGGRPRRQQTLVEAAKANDHRALLVALRSRYSAAIEDPDCKPPAMAALGRQLQIVDKEIAAIDREAQADQEADGDNSGTDETWDSSAI